MPVAAPAMVEILEGDAYVEVRYLGVYSIDRFVRQMELSARACSERKLDRVLLDLTRLEKYRPTTLERYKMGTLGASMSRGLTKVAVIGTWEQIGKDQFASTVARNQGLPVRVFLEREDAIAWLQLPAPARTT
jgi:hypothetical protein